MKHFMTLLLTVLLCCNFAEAQKKKSKAAPRKNNVSRSAPAKKSATKPVAKSNNNGNSTAFQTAFNLYKNKQYTSAAESFYGLSKNGDTKSKLYFGISLYRLSLFQVAAIALMDVTARGTPDQKRMALDYLVAIADRLNEPTLLSYSLRQATPDSMSETAKGVYELRKADILADESKWNEAKSLYEQAMRTKKTERTALYSLGVMHLKMKQPKEAAGYFEELYAKTQNESILSMERGLAIMGAARAYYQAKDWEKAALYYRFIPKDHALYRQSLFELSWALFRNVKFRSAMSPIQTLHSPFYENFYQPESVLLRGVILLFICRFDELEKVVENYRITYKTASAEIDRYLARNPSATEGFQLLNSAYRGLQRIQKGQNSIVRTDVPFFVVRTFLEEHNVRPLLGYFDHVVKEGQMVNSTFRGKKNADLRKYAIDGLNGRLAATREKLGKETLRLLKQKSAELQDLTTQMEFLNYEMLGGKREQLRKKMSVNHVEKETQEIKRSYLVQNGYRLWPFEGEYWRDEIGNYQYMGGNHCE